MSGSATPRPSDRTAAPDDVTDPLLWRLAVDVADAHQPDEAGRCGNPLCAGQTGPCDALVNAERAIAVARGVTPAPRSAALDTDAPAPADTTSEQVGWGDPASPSPESSRLENTPIPSRRSQAA